ncbi:MAG TPA: TldD/PmbA family protein [Deltaproteobacteria bacterium]|nr:TldD/PmbA family protein [Deltaproteobacteria bacterium]HOI08284.1 TldD/PmbA family protein [Deltaproteobacteria bacterium]
MTKTDIDYEGLLRRALRHGGDFSELFVEHRRGTSIVSEARRIEKYLSSEESGAGLRVVIGDRQAYAYTNDFSALGELADTVASAVKKGLFEGALNLEKRSPRSVNLLKTSPMTVDSAAKIGMVNRAERTAWGKDPSVIQVKVMYGDGVRHVVIANSKGFLVEDRRDSIVFVVQGVVAGDSLVETGYESVGGTRGFELFDEEQPEVVADRALTRALQTIRARKAPAGAMPVVLSSEAGGTMVHEAIGHGLEADLAGEGLSVYSGQIGNRVASDAITVIDDGSIPGLRGSMGYDDEGSPTEKTVLVDRGILKTYLTDFITAMKFGLPLSGNGRRESFRNRPIPRMTNTIIQPGTMNPEDIIKGVTRGVFVRKMGGGQVNTVNGDFVFNISEGYLIENGKVGEPIRGATLIGNGPKVLKSIELVGSDLGFGIGTCGKDGQGAPVADAQPTLLIPEITVGGEIEKP